MKFLLVIMLAGVMISARAPESTPYNVDRLVATTCLGDCGIRGVMHYRVPAFETDAELLFRVENFKLDLSHGAAAAIFVDGKEVDRFMLNGDSFYHLNVPSGTRVKIVVEMRTVNPEIPCDRLDRIDFGLYVLQ